MGKFSMMCIGAAGRYQRFVAANEDEKSEFKKSNNGDIAYNCSECGHAGLIKDVHMATRREEERLNNSSESQQTFGQRLPHSDMLSRSTGNLTCLVNNLHPCAASKEEEEKEKSSRRRLKDNQKSSKVLRRLHKSLGLSSPDLVPLVPNEEASSRSPRTDQDEEVSCFSKCEAPKFAPESEVERRSIGRIWPGNGYDRDDEEMLLRRASWYQPGLSRDICVEILSPQPTGAFLVRCSESRPDAFALSIKVPNQSVVHYLVISNCHGWKIKGSTKCFPSLSSLIVHHSVMSELLPCPLVLTSTALASLPTSAATADESGDDVVDLSDYPDLLFTLRKAFGSTAELAQTNTSLSPATMSEISSTLSSL